MKFRPTDQWFRISILILLVGLTLTGVLTATALSLVKPRFEATASLLLIPGEQSIPDRANPFLFLGGVSQARDVLVKIANAETTRAELLGSSGSRDYEVSFESPSSTPMMLVSAEASTPGGALELRDAVLKMLPSELKRFQDEADTPRNNRISSMLLVQDTEAQMSTKARLRAMVLAIAMGLGLTASLLALVQSLARRQRTQPPSGPTDRVPALARTSPSSPHEPARSRSLAPQEEWDPAEEPDHAREAEGAGEHVTSGVGSRSRL